MVKKGLAMVYQKYLKNCPSATIIAQAEAKQQRLNIWWSTKRSLLSEYKKLKKAVTHHWILNTSKVKELIGITPRVGKDEMTFVWGSFTFTKAGKLGNQMGWLVSKS